MAIAPQLPLEIVGAIIDASIFEHDDSKLQDFTNRMNALLLINKSVRACAIRKIKHRPFQGRMQSMLFYHLWNACKEDESGERSLPRRASTLRKGCYEWRAINDFYLELHYIKGLFLLYVNKRPDFLHLWLQQMPAKYVLINFDKWVPYTLSLQDGGSTSPWYILLDHMLKGMSNDYAGGVEVALHDYHSHEASFSPPLRKPLLSLRISFNDREFPFESEEDIREMFRGDFEDEETEQEDIHQRQEQNFESALQNADSFLRMLDNWLSNEISMLDIVRLGCVLPRDFSVIDWAIDTVLKHFSEKQVDTFAIVYTDCVGYFSVKEIVERIKEVELPILAHRVKNEQQKPFWRDMKVLEIFLSLRREANALDDCEKSGKQLFKIEHIKVELAFEIL